MAFTQPYSDQYGNTYPAAHFQMVSMTISFAQSGHSIAHSHAIWKDTTSKQAGMLPLPVGTWDFTIAGADYDALRVLAASGTPVRALRTPVYDWVAARPEFAGATRVADV